MKRDWTLHPVHPGGTDLDATTQLFSILLVITALAMIMVVGVAVSGRVRRQRTLPAKRAIPAYDALPGYVGLSIESNRPLHLSLGSAGIGGLSTMLTLVSTELFYQVARRAAIGDIPPLVTMSDASALPIAQDTLRRAYRTRNRVDFYRYTSARWYPSGGRSLAYAAALTALTGDNDMAANVLAGSFGSELALIMESGERRRIPSLAVSDQLEGQAVAYAFSEHVLIGEEIFTAGAYLEDNPSQIAEFIVQDALRYVVVAGLLLLLASRLLAVGG